MQNRPIEILAPAGGMDMLRAAVFAGADAVYLGLSGFNARAGAQNFTAETLPAAVAFCHARGARVYAALNTLVLPRERAAACAAITAAADAGCDALIVQDLGVARLAHAIAPGLQLHGSTQMSVTSPAGVRTLAALGFTRVIVARELSQQELAPMAAESPLELEVFVHGALCVCVSGQCGFSAFLGGRSANRGACAGPCRLPFYASVGADALPSPAERHTPAGEEAHALSLRDLSILPALPQLQQMGIASAKIEGRLRGPEYVAAVVDAAVKARAGMPYDAAFVQDIFSRGAFTKNWYEGKNNVAIFGARSEADTTASRAAQPRARALYRREAPRVPVTFTLKLTLNGGQLQVSDGTHTLHASMEGPLAPAQSDPAPALRAALAKTGGTPFYVDDATGIQLETDGLFIPAAILNAARRTLLAQLLALRETPPTAATHLQPPALSVPVRPAAVGTPTLRARFASVAQLPENPDAFAEILLPLDAADKVPAAQRSRTRLYLPRAAFGPAQEARLATQIAQAAEQGFLGFEADNLAHLDLLRGLPFTGGPGLNVANADAACLLAQAGCTALTLSPELSLRQAAAVAANSPVPTDLIAYGHLPLMVTRACPLMAERPTGCAGCPKSGVLIDRKGTAFWVICQDDIRTIHNSVSLYMGDRLAELPADTATLVFTGEDPAAVAAVLANFSTGRTPAHFTRGLYDKGVAAPTGGSS